MNSIDHIIFAVPDLARGVREIERLLGVAPTVGGRHPAYGTHNALLSLGDRTYLEVIAPDPGLAVPRRGVLLERAGRERPGLVTWVAAVRELDRSASALRAAGASVGEVGDGARMNPDGCTLRWRLTDPYALPMEGAVPFLIDWGETPHPAASAPPAGELVRLTLEHPRDEELARALEPLGSLAEVRAGERYRISATILTPGGPVEIG